MIARSHPHCGASVVLIGLLGMALAVGGCGSSRRSQIDRLPDAPQLVGGGMMIQWRAPVSGTVYLVEKRTGRIIETRSLAQDEVYSFEVKSIVQADEYEELLGISFARTRFLLYFEPTRPAGSARETTRTSESVQARSRSGAK